MSNVPAKDAEESTAIARINELLSSAGLHHGHRRILSAGWERQLKHPRQVVRPAKRPAKIAKTRLDVVRAPEMDKISWLLHGFSTRTGGRSHVYRPDQRAGELNLGFSASDLQSFVEANRGLFLKHVTGDAQFPIVTLRQIHSQAIRLVSVADTGPRALHKADGMMTGEAGLLLGIQTADCIPVLIADTKNRAVAAFHAGWRGTLKRIVEVGIGRMRLEFGSRPENLIAAIGPGIGQCCYAVGEEVRNEFESQFSYAAELFCEVFDSDPIREKYPLLFLTARAPGHSNTGPSLHLDLVEANRRQLVDAGLRPAAISIASECTSCRNDRYFSYRAENGFTGRMLSVIGVRP